MCDARYTRRTLYQGCADGSGIMSSLRRSDFVFTEDQYKAKGAARNWVFGKRVALGPLFKVMSRVVNACPTSAPSERDWSLWGRVWDPRRARLSAKRAGETVFVATHHELVRKRRHMRFLEGAKKRHRPALRARLEDGVAAGDASDGEAPLTEDEGDIVLEGGAESSDAEGADA